MLSQGDSEYIAKLLANFNPSEILIAKQQKKIFNEKFGEFYNLFFLDEWVYNSDFANELIQKQFKTNSIALAKELIKTFFIFLNSFNWISADLLAMEI